MKFLVGEKFGSCLRTGESCEYFSGKAKTWLLTIFNFDLHHSRVMSSGNSSVSQAFINELASDIANQLNRSVPNENLAKQVVSFAEKLPTAKAFVQACQAFGKFKEEFLLDVYGKVSHTSKGLVIKKEFEENNTNTLAGVEQKAGLLLPPKRESSPSTDRYPQAMSKSKYGLDRLAKKIKLENEQKIKQEVKEEYEPDHKLNTLTGDKKISFRKVVNVSQQKKERDSANDTGLSKLSSSAREKLEAIRAKRGQNSQNLRDRNQPSSANQRFQQDQRNQRERESDQKLVRSRSRREDSHNDTQEQPFPFGDDEFDFESQRALDRDWYLGDEYGHIAGDDSHNPFGDGFFDESREKALQQKVTTRMSNIARQKQKEADLWEQKQMITSGVQGKGYVDTDFDDENENRIHLFVHNLRPPFLDGQQVFTRQKDPVSAVLDPQSDMAVFAKKGSALVRERRQKRERQKQAKEAASMAGTTLGNVLGVRENAAEEEENEIEKSNKFSDHVKKNEGSSDFSKNLSVKEQRQFLPAFAVREDLLKVIRDNQGNVTSTPILVRFLTF